MKKAHIRIYIQPENYTARHAQEFFIDLDSPLIADIMDSQALTTHSSPCSLPPIHPVEIRRTALIGNREEIARRLAHLFTKKILETFEGTDTIDGYSKEEWKEMHGPVQYVTPAELYYICKVYPEVASDRSIQEEYNKVEHKTWWEVAARSLNKVIKNKEIAKW